MAKTVQKVKRVRRHPEQQAIQDKDGKQIGVTIIIKDGDGKEISRQNILNGQDGKNGTLVRMVKHQQLKQCQH